MLVAYQAMLLAQAALLSLVITSTIICLEPLFLFITIHATLIFGHFLAEIVLDCVKENMMHNASNTLNAFFYNENAELKQSLTTIMSTACETRNSVEGSPINRFFHNAAQGFLGLFHSRPSSPTHTPEAFIQEETLQGVPL